MTGSLTFPSRTTPFDAFKGLPGLLADSLPDKFGNAVLGAWLAEQGRSIDSLTALERLAYTGSRGIGALEYRPALLDADDAAEAIKVDELARLADEVLNRRKEAHAELKAGMRRYGNASPKMLAWRKRSAPPLAR